MLEMYVGRLVLTSLGYFLGLVVIYGLAVMCAAGLDHAVFGKNLLWFPDLNVSMLYGIQAFFAVHSIFMVGALYFKRGAFWKTLLVAFLFCLGVILFAVAALSSLNLIFDVGPNIMRVMKFDLALFTTETSHASYIFRLPMQSVLHTIIAPICWIIGYYRLADTEV